MDPESLAPEIAAEPENVTTVVTVDISDTQLELMELDAHQTVVTLEDVSGNSQLEPIINLPFQQHIQNVTDTNPSFAGNIDLADIVSSFIQ